MTTALTEYSVVNGVTTFNWIPSAQTLYASSDNATDTAHSVVINGLDANWNEQTKVVALNGQTKVAVSGSWARAFTMMTYCGCATVGNVYL